MRTAFKCIIKPAQVCGCVEDAPRLRVGGPTPRGASGPGAPPAAPPGPPAALALMSPPHSSAISGLPTSTLQSSAAACVCAVQQR